MQPQDNSNQEPSSSPPPETPGASSGTNQAQPSQPYTQSSPFAPASQQTQPSPASSYPANPNAGQNPQAARGGIGKNKKLLIGGIAGALLLLGGSAAAYFGVVLPNKPENVWKSAIENTGKGYDKLVDYADSQKDTKGAKLDGKFKFEGAGTVADGTVNGKYDEKNSETKVTLGASGVRFEAIFLTNIPDGAKNPDVYTKISGLKGIDQLLGPQAGGIGASLASFDNQWYFVDHTIFDQAEKAAAEENQAAASLTTEDFTAFARDIGSVSDEYLFTDNPSKAVLVVKQNVGKETMDGRSVYHYKVGVNKANLKDYNKALCDKVLESKVYKALSMGTSSDELKAECYDTKDIDSINENDTVDVYVDLKTKLIRIVRIAQKDNSNNYFDMGLLYTGGDEFPFVIRGQANQDGVEAKGELKMVLNTKSNKVTIIGNLDGKQSGETYKLTLDATAEPSNDKVEFKKPEGAKSLLEAYGGLLGATGAAGGGAAVPDQQLLNRCLAAPENALPPECQTLFGEL